MTIVNMWIAIIYMQTALGGAISWGIYAGYGSVWETIEECQTEGQAITASMQNAAASGVTYSYVCQIIPELQSPLGGP